MTTKIFKSIQEYVFSIFEVKGNNKLRVVSGSCKIKKQAEQELSHYLMMYAQDLPKDIKLKVEKNWK